MMFRISVHIVLYGGRGAFSVLIRPFFYKVVFLRSSDDFIDAGPFFGASCVVFPGALLKLEFFLRSAPRLFSDVRSPCRALLLLLMVRISLNAI